MQTKMTSSKTKAFQPIINGKIQIHPKTDRTTKLWNELKVKQVMEGVTPLKLHTPMSEDNVRFVCLSDTHNVSGVTPAIVPDGDVLLHAGDFSQFGGPCDVEEFNAFLGKLLFISFNSNYLILPPHSWISCS